MLLALSLIRFFSRPLSMPPDSFGPKHMQLFTQAKLHLPT